MINKEEVERIASLIKLEVTPEEVDSLQSHFNKILGYFELLGRLPLDNVDPFTGDEDTVCPMREDIVFNWDNRESLRELETFNEENYFEVPSILGEDN